MARNRKVISGRPMNSSLYDPNALSIFPNLLPRPRVNATHIREPFTKPPVVRPPSAEVDGIHAVPKYDPNALSIFPYLLPPRVNATQTGEPLTKPPPVRPPSAGVDGIHAVPKYDMAVQNDLCRNLITVTPIGLAFTSAVQHADGTSRSTINSTVARIRAMSRENNPARPRVQLRQQHSPAIFDESSNIGDMFKNETADEKQSEPELKNGKINIKCLICQTPFFVPMSTQCGHLFCKDCITRAVVVRKQCPVCSERTSTRNLFRVYF